MIGFSDIRLAIAVVLAGIGALFFFVGTVGLLRLPDFYSRAHATSKCDTVGAGSLLLALAVLGDIDTASAKTIVLAALVLLTSPTIGHSLARAAYRTGLTPWVAEEE